MSPNFNYINCLKPLLRILGWQGNARDIFEAVPFEVKEIDLIDLKNIFVDLGYVCYDKKINLSELNRSFLPTLFINEDLKIFWVIYERSERDYLYIDCVTGQKKAVSVSQKIKGTRYNFIRDDTPARSTDDWFDHLIHRFIAEIKYPIILSIFRSIAIIAPAFLAYYSFSGMIGTQNSTTLLMIIGCMITSLVALFTLSWSKNKSLAYVSARLSFLINHEAMSHLLNLDADHRHNLISATETTRLKQMDCLQDRLSRISRAVISDIPVVVMSLFALMFVNLPLGITALMGIVFSVIHLKLNWSALTTKFAGLAQQDKIYQQFQNDAVIVGEDVRSLSAQRLWIHRLKTYLSDYIQAHKLAIGHLGMINYQQIAILVLTLIIGSVVAGNMVSLTSYSSANLITSSILIFLGWSHYIQLTYILGDLSQTVILVREISQWIQHGREPRNIPKIRHIPQGEILIDNLSFTYPGQDRMTLQAVNVQIAPGEIIAVVGQNASGKSTLIKLLMGLYSPNQGSIKFDGLDLTDLDLKFHRQNVAYVSSQVDLFSLTIAQNLRLAQPDVTEKEMLDVLEKLEALETIKFLPQGIHTLMTPELQKTLPSAFLQKINLARAFIRNSQILIFDEPTGNLDMKSDLAFKNLIQQLKGSRTIIIVTHRPSMINLADQVLVLNNGIMRLFGPTTQVLKILSGKVA